MGKKKGKKGGDSGQPPPTTAQSTPSTSTQTTVAAPQPTAQLPPTGPPGGQQPLGVPTTRPALGPPGVQTAPFRPPGGQQPRGPAPGGQPPLSQSPGAQQFRGPAPGSQQPRGPAPVGQQPRGPAPGGQQPRGPAPGGQQPRGPAPGGQQPRGPPPGGQQPRGPPPGGQQPRGPAPGGQPPRGPAPGGQPPLSQSPGAQQFRGPAPGSQQPRGPAPVGQQPRGPAPVGQQPRGPPPGGQQPRGPAPVGQQPRGPPPGAQQPRGPAPVGQQPRGPPPGAQQPRGPAPVGQQPRGPPPGAQQPRGPAPTQVKGKAEKKSDKDVGAISKAVSKVSVAPAYKPVLRPDDGGKVGYKIQLRANFFPMKFREDVVVYHYDVEIHPDVKSKVRTREVMNYFVKLQQRGGIFNNVYPVFDGRKNVYTAKKLHLKTSQDEIVFDMEGERRPFSVKIQLAGEIPFYPLWEFLNDRSRDSPLEAIQALDIVLREMPNSRFIPVSRYFFTDPTGDSMGPGLDLWKGYYQSVRPTQWKTVMLQLDTSVRVFHKGQHVLDLVKQFFEMRSIDEARNLEARDWARFRDHIKGLAVETTHQVDIKRTYKIINISEQPANRLKFPLNQPDGSEVPCIVSDYFKQQYNIDLRFPNLPCLQAQPKEKHRYIPMEFCEVKKGQQLKKLTDEMTANMIRKSAVPAPQRERQINDVVRQLDLNRDVYMKEFGLGFNPQMVEFDGRVLPPPSMEYSNNNKITPRNGSWNMRSAQFYSSARVAKMAVICFDDRTRNDTIMAFVRSLSEAARGLNMNLPAGLCENVLIGRRADDARGLLTSLCKKHGPELQLVIVILPNFRSSEVYGIVKKVGDTEIGVATQCVQPKNVFKNNQQTLVNICMKINSKLGEVNTIVDRTQRSTIFNRPVMIMGADVTHPSPGDTTKPSIAAVTASYDPMAYKYAAKISIQNHRVEIISNLATITRDLLMNFFKKTNGKKPEKIIFYRDGVSEGQFREVLAHELRAVQEACDKLEKGYQPAITFLVVQKRHHTRLFCRNDGDRQGRSGNVPAGTTVDKVIVHPVEFDFYLCSHEGIQGTSRPAHYHVLYDDNDFTSDELQKLTYHLCHVYARCTRSVSIPAPAYYAHHCAFRGRHYLDSSRTPDLPEREAEIARVLQTMNEACLTHNNITGMFFT